MSDGKPLNISLKWKCYLILCFLAFPKSSVIQSNVSNFLILSDSIRFHHCIVLKILKAICRFPTMIYNISIEQFLPSMHNSYLVVTNEWLSFDQMFGSILIMKLDLNWAFTNSKSFLQGIYAILFISMYQCLCITINENNTRSWFGLQFAFSNFWGLPHMAGIAEEKTLVEKLS